MTARPVVRTAAGAVLGATEEHASVFHGVPYAAEAVGAQRFAAPSPASAWDGVRDASTPGPSAPAPERGKFGALDMSPVIGPGWRPGADYRTATVFTPDPGAGGLPVLVFVHGGGFLAGAAASPVLRGETFARDGVVFVALQYRLGVPGWLHLPDAPDNRGLLDVLAGLGWVRENIAAFGGDPDNVTLAGQSAGAMIGGAALATAPDGLFRRVITQSGNGLGAFTVEQAGAITEAVAAELGVPARAEAFAQLPDERLVTALSSVAGTDNGGPLSVITPVNLVAGTETLPAQSAELVRDGRARGSEVPLLIGDTTEEANLYLVPTGRSTAHADRLTAELFGDGTTALAQAHGAAHRYRFSWRSPAFDGRLGAAHTMDLPFVFDHIGLSSLHGPEAMLGQEEPPAEVADAMHRAWVGFVTDGDPGWQAGTTREFA